MISYQLLAQKFLIKYVISAFGLDNRVLLGAAHDRFNVQIDIPDLMDKDNGS